MFATKNQFFVFFACVAIGGLGGILFTVSAFIKFFIKDKRLKIIPDIVAFSIFSVWYVQAAYLLEFPSHRVYMVLGAIMGLLLYMKSFNYTLAFRTEKLYNITIKKLVEYKSAGKIDGKKDVKRKRRKKINGNKQ